MFVALKGRGPYIFRGEVCVIVKLNNSRAASKFISENGGVKIKRTAHVVFNGRMLSVASVAVGIQDVKDATSMTSDWAEKYLAIRSLGRSNNSEEPSSSDW